MNRRRICTCFFGSELHAVSPIPRGATNANSVRLVVCSVFFNSQSCAAKSFADGTAPYEAPRIEARETIDAPLVAVVTSNTDSSAAFQSV